MEDRCSARGNVEMNCEERKENVGAITEDENKRRLGLGKSSQTVQKGPYLVLRSTMCWTNVAASRLNRPHVDCSL